MSDDDISNTSLFTMKLSLILYKTEYLSDCIDMVNTFLWEKRFDNINRHMVI